VTRFTKKVQQTSFQERYRGDEPRRGCKKPGLHLSKNITRRGTISVSSTSTLGGGKKTAAMGSLAAEVNDGGEGCGKKRGKKSAMSLNKIGRITTSVGGWVLGNGLKRNVRHKGKGREKIEGTQQPSQEYGGGGCWGDEPR